MEPMRSYMSMWRKKKKTNLFISSSGQRKTSNKMLYSFQQGTKIVHFVKVESEIIKWLQGHKPGIRKKI